MKTKIFIFSLFFLGIILRFYLSSIAINRSDILVHFDWSKTIYKTGLMGSYSYPVWTYSPATQPPLMMINFWLSKHFYENRYLLAELHNKIKIPNAGFILWFDKYGENILIRIWAILGDIVCSFFVFWIILKIKNNNKLALIGSLIFFFNPITIFETCIWGQNDIYSSAFILISFLLIFYKKIIFLSPLIFTLGILAKPTGLIIAPFYCIYYLSNFDFKKLSIALVSIFKILVSLILSLSFFVYSFSFFVSNNLIKEIIWIITNRISNSSKGISLASVSAFNFYSLFFNIDNTPGSTKISIFTLDNFGFFIYFLLNILAFYLLFRYKKQFKDKYSLLMFLIYLITQGSFLFMTSMLERYFLLALAPSIILMICFYKIIGIKMIVQQTIWFLNLIYAFYWRDFGIIKNIFLGSNSIVIRLLSILSLINFFLISFVMIRYIRNQSNLKTKAS